jgi:hypothetical protein
MIFGFTGTRKGCTTQQKTILYLEMAFIGMTKALHGDCIGADSDFHGIAKSFTEDIEIYPPLDPANRAFCKAEIIHDVAPYLERNKSIVDACDTLVACPETAEEVKRSGTWSTIRYALKQKKPVVIIEPDGSQVRIDKDGTRKVNSVWSGTP